MKEQFVTYDIALKLKEKGFDEPCLAAYNQSDENKFMIAPQLSSYQIASGKNSDVGKIEKVTAPLWQQVIDWFEDKYKISVTVVTYTSFKNDKLVEVGYTLYNISIMTGDRHTSTIYPQIKKTKYEANIIAIERALTLI